MIVGGGPAGCATALALHRRGFENLTVLEAGAYDAVRIGESVPPDIRLLFAELGILDSFIAEAHQPCLGSSSSWGHDEMGFNDFVVNPHGHGWHLDRLRFERFLAAEVRNRGISLLTKSRIMELGYPANGPVELTSLNAAGESVTLNVDFVVDASGRQSTLATRFGAHKRVLDRLVGVTAFFEGCDQWQQGGLTLLEAVEYGWWYAAKLPGEKVAVMVATDPELVKSLRLNTITEWLSRLSETRHVAAALGQVEYHPSRLILVPALCHLLSPVVGNRWLAVGDAASTYDPISSQGIYKAFFDGIEAAQAIHGFFNDESAVLDRYQSSVHARFEDYLSNRNYFYGIERRWEASSFWARRRSRSVVGIPDSQSS